MSNQTKSNPVVFDRVAQIRRRAISYRGLGGMIPVREYLADVGHLLIENDSLKSQLDLERAASKANFDEYQRAQDENDRLTVEIMVLRREGKD